MDKIWYQSKTIQGIVIALFGSLLAIWIGDSEISRTIIAAGLGWAGYGLRDAIL